MRDWFPEWLLEPIWGWHADAETASGAEVDNGGGAVPAGVGSVPLRDLLKGVAGFPGARQPCDQRGGIDDGFGRGGMQGAVGFPVR